MSMWAQILWCVGSVLAFRIFLAGYCKQVENKKRLAHAAGMMLAYTAMLMWMIYMAGETLFARASVKEFRIYICAMVFTVNIVIGFITIVYCSTARKRTLSNREKIMLKDL